MGCVTKVEVKEVKWLSTTDINEEEFLVSYFAEDRFNGSGSYQYYYTVSNKLHYWKIIKAEIVKKDM
jgi:hypothetical protein